MAMVDVVSQQPTGGPMDQVRRLGPKDGSHLALFCIHRMNWVNSRNDSESWCWHHKQCPGYYHFIIIIITVPTVVELNRYFSGIRGPISLRLCTFVVRLSMKVSSLQCEILLCTYFSQTLNHQGSLYTFTNGLTTERILAVWNCPCRQGYRFHCLSLCIFCLWGISFSTFETLGWVSFNAFNACKKTCCCSSQRFSSGIWPRENLEK